MAELVSGEALLFAVLDPFELYLDPLPLEAIRIEALRPPGDVLRTWDI